MIRVKVENAAVLPAILEVLDPEESVTIKYTGDYYELTFSQEQIFDDIAFQEETLKLIEFSSWRSIDS
jgi:hypothetical protein